MNRPNRFFSLHLGALVATIIVMTTTGTLSAAPPSARAAIEARQSNYKKMGAAMKMLKDQLSSGSPSNVAMASAARTLAETARRQASLFPAGSGPSSGVKTDALPGIWKDRAAFDAQMRKLAAEADKLVAAAGTGNVAAITAQYRTTGAVCGACHRRFRADN